jgi:TRAP-type mannitol/chloroaromatic compound transport system substrate-binding protein
VGKSPAFALGSAVPFGMNYRLQNAWLMQSGGLEANNEFFAKFNTHAILAGNTGVQMGGWFNKEIKAVQDLQGLKFRIAGFAGKVMERLGAVPQQIAGGDIYPALEKGTIDAAEWVGPYDDEKLGFAKVAKFYYYPGFWEAGPSIFIYFNLQKWNELPKQYQEICRAAGALAMNNMIAKYDVLNPQALRRLVAAGAQLRPFPQDVMEAAFRASQEIYDETSKGNEDFKKIYESWGAYRNDGYLWWQVADLTMDAFMVRSRSLGQRG